MKFPTQPLIDYCMNRKKMRAFMEYFRDVEIGEVNTNSFYAIGWEVRKNTAGDWIKEFKEKITLFKSALELHNIAMPKNAPIKDRYETDKKENDNRYEKELSNSANNDTQKQTPITENIQTDNQPINERYQDINRREYIYNSQLTDSYYGATDNSDKLTCPTTKEEEKPKETTTSKEQEITTELVEAEIIETLPTNQKSKKSVSKAKFVKPTMEEIASVIEEKSYQVDAERFFAYYEANGWRVGRNPMQNWKMALVTWQKGNTKQKANNSNYGDVKERMYMLRVMDMEIKDKLKQKGIDYMEVVSGSVVVDGVAWKKMPRRYGGGYEYVFFYTSKIDESEVTKLGVN